MINVAARGQDQAILSVLAELGCRVGELVSSRIKDIKPTGDFTRLTFRKGKTGLRTVPLKESIIYLNEWLRVHPYKYDPYAPLCVSKDKIPPKKYSKERVYKPLMKIRFSDSCIKRRRKPVLRKEYLRICFATLAQPSSQKIGPSQCYEPFWDGNATAICPVSILI